MTEEQIEYLANRFLGWRLPENFNPDDGISFDPIQNRGHAFESRRQPTGTNLFDAGQALAMVRYMVEGLPQAPGHTDLMVAPETLDAYLEANPLPEGK